MKANHIPHIRLPHLLLYHLPPMLALYRAALVSSDAVARLPHV